MPVDASRLYARNVSDLLLLMTSEGEVVPDFDDEVVAGCWVTRDGRRTRGDRRSMSSDGWRAC